MGGVLHDTLSELQEDEYLILGEDWLPLVNSLEDSLALLFGRLEYIAEFANVVL